MGGVACGRDLGSGQLFPSFLSLADHMPDYRYVFTLCQIVILVLFQLIVHSSL